MSEVVEHYEQQAKFEDQNEAVKIRLKLERLVNNILEQVKKRDNRFQSTLIYSGSVYEGVKVHQPDEFDFMIALDDLRNKPKLYTSDKGNGYVKLVLDESGWKEFEDDEGFFNPNLLSRHFKKLVNEALSDAEIPQDLVVSKTNQDLLDSPWAPVYFTLLGNSTGKDNPAGTMYSETHGPATTLYIRNQAGGSYNNLTITVDLTLSLECQVSKLPVQLANLPTSVDNSLNKTGVHLVPAGFDSWRISFSVIEKEILSTAPGGFKVCFRVIKTMRNTIQQRLGLGQSTALIPSYLFKTVLLSEIFRKDRRWQDGDLHQVVDDVLALILQGIEQENITSFFEPGYNLLSTGDHENRLRQCILKEMLNDLRGLEKTHHSRDVKETRQQIRVLEMIDLLDYVISSTVSGKDPTTVWNKMFVNIETIPQSQKFGHFWNQITDLNSTELDDNTYNFLVGIWNTVEVFFKKLLTHLPVQGELNVLAQKFYIRTCEKKKEYEKKHQITSKCDVHQIPLHQLAYEMLHDLAECYTDDVGYAFWSKLHKGVPRGYKSSEFFREVTEVTVNCGSETGFAMFKERMKQYISLVSEQVLIDAMVNYIRQIFYFARDILKSKLDYVKMPELDLD